MFTFVAVFFCLGDFYKFLYLYIEADVSCPKKNTAYRLCIRSVVRKIFKSSTENLRFVSEKSSNLAQKICDCLFENLQMLVRKYSNLMRYLCINRTYSAYCNAPNTVSIRCVKVWRLMICSWAACACADISCVKA